MKKQVKNWPDFSFLTWPHLAKPHKTWINMYQPGLT